MLKETATRAGPTSLGTNPLSIGSSMIVVFSTAIN
jgi:hypothetical protein